MRLRLLATFLIAACLAACDSGAPATQGPELLSVIVTTAATGTPANGATGSTLTPTPVAADTATAAPGDYSIPPAATATATLIFAAFATDTPMSPSSTNTARPTTTNTAAPLAPPTATNTSLPPPPSNTPPVPTNTHRPPTSTPVAQTSTPRPPDNTPTNTSAPPSATPTTTFATTGDIRVFLVGFNPAGGEQYEHIHLYNCDTKPINVSGWKVRSPATGDVYTFGSYVANPGCGGQVQFTVNTHVTGFENASKGIFTWNQPLAHEEWPNSGGTAEVYNAANALVVRCTYSPTVVAAPGDAYCR